MPGKNIGRDFLNVLAELKQQETSWKWSWHNLSIISTFTWRAELKQTSANSDSFTTTREDFLRSKRSYPFCGPPKLLLSVYRSFLYRE